MLDRITVVVVLVCLIGLLIILGKALTRSIKSKDRQGVAANLFLLAVVILFVILFLYFR